MSPPITITTDFGTSDPYVAAMKGQILGICPEAPMVDITHEIPPQHILRAALAVQHAAPFFPAGSIHLVVVDPGVGTARRPLLVKLEHGWAVGPDNGVLSLLWDSKALPRCYQLIPGGLLPSAPSATFQGRDLFAPAAAHLAAGIAPKSLGREVADPVQLSLPRPTEHADSSVEGSVLFADHFGNLVTNLRPHHVDQRPELVLEVAGRSLHAPLFRTFAEIPSGQVGLVLGSAGLLELVVNQGSASAQLGLGEGDSVVVQGGS